VDSRFGDIRVGDLLAPSSIPGVAMKAVNEGPVIGTALEDFSDGRGLVLALVHRDRLSRAAAKEPNTEIHAVSESIEPGDVLVVDRDATNTLRRGSVAADPGVVGIAVDGSETSHGDAAAGGALNPLIVAARLDQGVEPAVRLREALTQDSRPAAVSVAASGTVLCKVDASYGEIHVGDLLTTSPTRGCAMRSSDAAPGTIVGKALESLNHGTGLIRVLVLNR
jgi:hypothetical protein